MKERVIEFIKEILEETDRKLETEITESSHLRDIGLSSFDLATLTVKIEDEFDVDIFENGLVNTVGEIVEILAVN